MPSRLIDLDQRFKRAIRDFWKARAQQKVSNLEGGRIDSGSRGAVTGGTQFGSLEVLIRDILLAEGFKPECIRTRTAIELPGYYRAEKKWDLLVILEGKLVAAIELKSQAGSFGNNFNNRSEEAIGSASDLWTAYREGLFGDAPRPFLGYFFLLEDIAAIRKPVRVSEPYFKTDPVFNKASYLDRYSILCRRLVLERLYDAACLTCSTSPPTKLLVTHPTPQLSFERFISELLRSTSAFLSQQ